MTYKEYKNYINDNPQGYWFRKRLFGWGWIPVLWQGWVVIGIYILALLALPFTVSEVASTEEVWVDFLIPLIVLTAILLGICYKKGEKPGWQWGIPDKYKEN